MDCPRCNGNASVVLAEDSIKCDCGRVQFMQYWYCSECNYSFRTNNGKLLDGWDLSQIIVENSCRDMSDALKKAVTDKSSMMDFVRPCVRCSDTTTYESRPGVYCCSNCGFEWEILENV